MAEPSVRGPLAGLLVADLSRILAGPYATMLLADLGAEVIKVEGPKGDDTRTWQPPDRDGVATYYLGINRNKRSIALDFADPADADLARELVARSDIVIENFRPGGLNRFGLDYETVAAANPTIIYASISGFGSGEKGAVLPGYDLMVQAISGLMSLTGDPDGPGYRAGISVFDVMAGLHATIGVLAALHKRHETGRGQHVEVNLLSSALSGLVNHSSAYVAGGTVPYRMGNSHPSLFPYEPLPCADGDLIITAGNDGQFAKLCAVLDLPELVDDPRFAHNQDRTANRDELRPLLVERLQTRTKQEWFSRDHRRRRALRTDQHHRRRGRVRDRDRPGPGGRGRPGGACGAQRPAPDHASRRVRRSTGCRRPGWTSTAPRSAPGWKHLGSR